MAQLDYTADYNDQYKGIESLPPDTYKVQIVDSDIQTPSSGDGKMLILEYEVVGHAKYSGRKIREWLKFAGTGETKYAIQKINTIFYLTGTKGIKDTAQLHGKTLSILVGVKPAGEDKNGVFRESSNFVKKYLPFNGDSEQEESQEKASGSKKPKFVK